MLGHRCALNLEPAGRSGKPGTGHWGPEPDVSAPSAVTKVYVASPVGELLCTCVTGHGQHPEQHLQNVSASIKVFEADLTLCCSQEAGFLSCTSLSSGTSSDLADCTAAHSH